MDPKACLERARAAHQDRDIDGARAALGDYLEWRRKGGCEPTMEDGTRGDAFAARLITRLMRKA